ncbi:MAG: hypothetical protein ACTHLE_08495 [Agriterribacter sp.]
MITGYGEEMCMSPGSDNNTMRGEDASHSDKPASHCDKNSSHDSPTAYSS